MALSDSRRALHRHVRARAPPSPSPARRALCSLGFTARRCWPLLATSSGIPRPVPLPRDLHALRALRYASATCECSGTFARRARRRRQAVARVSRVLSRQHTATMRPHRVGGTGGKARWGDLLKIARRTEEVPLCGGESHGRNVGAVLEALARGDANNRLSPLSGTTGGT